MTASATYGASPTKRFRRTKASIRALRDELHDIVREIQPATVRQVFYQAVSRKLIAKTEQEYKGTVCRLLADMRRDKELPYDWIADNTRWQRKPDTHRSLESALEQTQRHYRRDVWLNQNVYVEVWLEKDALSGVLWDVTERWDVPLMVTRGYPSLSFLHSAGEAMADEERPVHLYYFGDRDPSGQDIPRVVERTLREMTPNADIRFQLVAVTEQQIDEYDLPTRPTKTTDSRSKSFQGESVEVDAISPHDLRKICDDCITQHLDVWHYEAMRRVEAAERETLRSMIDSMRGGSA